MVVPCLGHVHIVVRVLLHTVSNFSCSDGEVRLIGGATENEGTIQVCMGNRFGTICDVGFNSVAAGVVCSSLGYPRLGKRMRYLKRAIPGVSKGKQRYPRQRIMFRLTVWSLEEERAYIIQE